MLSFVRRSLSRRLIVPQTSNEMIQLSKGVLSNEARLEGKSPWKIITDRQQWSYAFIVPLDISTMPDPKHTGIRIYGEVEAGEIGFLLVAQDLATMLGKAAQATEGWRGVLEINLDAAPTGLVFLVVRNNAKGSASRVTIERAEVFKSAPKAECPSALLPWERLTDDMPDRSRELFDLLRKKWSEVPAGLMDRKRTNDLSKISDEELLNYWTAVHAEASTGQGFKVRGWFHHIYSEMLAGKKVIDVGSGLGIDGITLAKAGARITFVDIVQENLDVIRRLCKCFELDQVDFLYLEDFDSLERLPRNLDVVWCQGSMINAPFDFMRRESQFMLRHLKIGGRWIELCYPRERWVREGTLPFSKWGEVTDGPGTPWMEWYDAERLLARLSPATFDTLFAFNFHNDDFNWFDLLRRS